MTTDQHIASDPSLSVWVSASAGTGKTKVLTDRVLRLLLSGAHPSRILCITYTKAAAAEMEQRIGARLGEWAIMTEEKLRAELHALTGVAADDKILRRARRLFAQVLDSPVRLRIQTIHAFCQSVLARFPLEAGIMPHFTLIEERTSDELLAEARTRLFTGQHDGDGRITEAIGALAALLGEGGLNDLLRDIIAKRRKFMPWFDETDGAERLCARVFAELGVAADADVETLLQRHFSYSAEEEAALKKACDVLAGGAATDLNTGRAIATWLAERRDYEAYCLAFLKATDSEPRQRIFTREVEKQWPPIRDVLAAEQQRVYRFSQDWRSLMIARCTRHVIVLGQAMLSLYRHLKTAHGYMDFDDLILHAVDLLTRSGFAPWVLYKLDGGLDHLLVDEAQDTSPEQWKLVKTLAAEFFAGEGARDLKRTVFVVGDEKQSIFSFQGADPRIFDKTQSELSRRIEASGAAFRRVRLMLSFRSTAPVLAAVDAVFAQPGARDGLVFGEADISHALDRKEMAGRVELWPLVESDAAETQEPWHIPTGYRYAQKPEVLCAEEIARTIAGWLRDKRELEARGRPVSPGDIMILVQRRGEFARAMLRALKKHRIPVAGADRLILTNHLAVQDCLALADFLLLPQDNLTLACVLKSPLCGLSEEALFELAHARGEQTLWERLKANRKYEKTYLALADLLAKVDYVSPHRLFTHLLETCGGRKALAARLGPEVDDPLNEFLALSMQYTETHPPSLQGFVHWLRSGETEIKRDMDKGRDEVRIMTVHGAKGLQAPIVFLPDTTREPRYEKGLLFTPGDRPWPLWSPFKAADDPHYRRLREAYRGESDRENRRLLYVAMTRAEDELYVCGYKGVRSVPEGCWYELIRRGAESCASWALAGDRRVMFCDQLKPPKHEAKAERKKPAEKLPPWAKRKAPQEQASARPLNPSQLEAEQATLSPLRDLAARGRGLLIHRMLQYLPDVPDGEHAAVAAHFTARYGDGFTAAEKSAVEREVLALLRHPDFAVVFGPGSVAEAPISGRVRDEKGQEITVSGQIDRLAVAGGDVYIVDYKTNRDVPAGEAQVPRAYLRQMEAYRRLVSAIYPDKTVHCALIWTSEAKLMLLSEAALTSLAA